MPIIPQLVLSKSALRSRSLTRRQALSPEHRKRTDSKIFARVFALEPVKLALSIFIYVSVHEEVDTRQPISEILTAGKDVFVPHITRGNGMVAAPFLNWSQLVLGPLKIPAPTQSGTPSRRPDVAIVPGLCFNEQGYRLGYGGGYYDRWLGQHPATISIGVFRDSDHELALPVEFHDVPLDFIVTPSRVLTIQGAKVR